MTRFNIKKFMTENKLTRNSRLLSESVFTDYKTLATNYDKKVQNISHEELEEYFKDVGIFYFHYYEPSDEIEDSVEIPEEQVPAVLDYMNGEGELPDGLPGGYQARLMFSPGNFVF